MNAVARIVAAVAIAAGIMLVSFPMTCDQVRTYVRSYGVARALAWARSNGWTEAQIAEARRECRV